MKKSLISTAVLCAVSSSIFANDMEHVLVSAARDGINRSESGSSVTLIDEASLALRPNTSVADILRSVPGVSVNQASGIGSQVQLRMRGGEANHVLVFIDGVQVNDPAQGDDYNFAHLFNLDIASIEVVRGPQSALWGSDALSGMIYIRSKDGQAGQQLQAFIEGGNQGHQRVGISTSKGNDNGFLRLSLNSMASDGINASNVGTERDGYNNDSAKLQALYRIDEQWSVGGNSLYIDSATHYDSLDYNYDYVTFEPLNPATYGLPIDATNRSESTQLYHRAFTDFVASNGLFKLHADLAYSSGKNHNFDESAWSTTGFDETISQAERLQYTLQGSITLNPQTTATVALEREEQDFALQSAWLNGNESMDSNSLALELQGQLGESLHYLVSARHDNNSDFDNATTYRMSAAWQAKSNIRLRGALGTGIKNPTFTELFGYSASFHGNPALQPEKSQSWEAGVDIAITHDIDVAITYFDANLQNEIRTVYDYTDWTSTSINEGDESDRNGVEIAANLRLSAQWDSGFTYTKLHASEAGMAEIRRPEDQASVYLNWRSMDNKSLMAVNVDHNGDMTDTFFGVSQQTVWLGAYTLLSINGSYQINDHMSIYGRIDNALDEDYEEIYGFNTAQASYQLGLRFNF